MRWCAATEKNVQTRWSVGVGSHLFPTFFKPKKNAIFKKLLRRKTNATTRAWKESDATFTSGTQHENTECEAGAGAESHADDGRAASAHFHSLLVQGAEVGVDQSILFVGAVRQRRELRVREAPHGRRRDRVHTIAAEETTRAFAVQRLMRVGRVRWQLNEYGRR